MADREQKPGSKQPEGDRKLTLDKEKLRDLDASVDDQEQIRGGREPGGSSVNSGGLS